MAETKQVSATSLKKGSYVIIDGVACIVKSTQTSRPGKHGHSKVRIEAVGMIEGQKKIIVVPGHDKMHSPIIEKKNAQVLSIQNDMANVMDMESYETFDLKIPDELKSEVVEGKEIVYWIIINDKIMKDIRG
ncbi:MAG: translation initiation factor IF-5A [Nanoarchaeota archaeon]